MTRRFNVRARAQGRVAALSQIEGGTKLEIGGTCGAQRTRDRQPCEREAGAGTAHLGVGNCDKHSGNSRFENSRGAWLMAHAMMGELDTTPWEALLRQVRRTAHEMAWLDQKVAECPSDDDLLPGGSHYPWVKMRIEAFNRHTRVAKMAIDAGVAERLVAQLEFEATAYATVLLNTLNALGLGPEVMEVARGIMRRELLALDSMPGEVVREEVVGEHG